MLKSSPMFLSAKIVLFSFSTFIFQKFMDKLVIQEIKNMVHVSTHRLSKYLAIRFMGQCNNTEESQSQHFHYGASGKAMEIASSWQPGVVFAFNCSHTGEPVRMLKSSFMTWCWTYRNQKVFQVVGGKEVFKQIQEQSEIEHEVKKETVLQSL